jgi:hypothetical protein
MHDLCILLVHTKHWQSAHMQPPSTATVMLVLWMTNLSTCCGYKFVIHSHN